MSKLSIHDNFIRSIMADKNIARDYFEHYLPSYISNGLDFETLEQSSDTYISKDLQKTMSDIVYTCRRKKEEGQVRISLLIEHKSYIDKNTTIQIGNYIFSGLLKQVRNKEEPVMIIPVLLYHGQEKWHYHTLADLFTNLDSKWKRYLPDFDYVYNDHGNLEDDDVEAINNKFLSASLLALKHTFEKSWLQRNIIRLLVQFEEADGNLQSGLIVYLFERSGLEEQKILEIIEEIPSILKNKVMGTWDIFVEKGKKIGFEEGIEKGKRDFVTNLLKNTDFETKKIAELVNVSVEFVSSIRAELIGKQ